MRRQVTSVPGGVASPIRIERVVNSRPPLPTLTVKELWERDDISIDVKILVDELLGGQGFTYGSPEYRKVRKALDKAGIGGLRL